MANKKNEAELKALYETEYVTGYRNHPVNRLSRLLPYMDLRQTDVVADFACGNGMLLDLIHDKVSEYHGVDFSTGFIEAANNRAADAGITNCHFYCADIIEFCRVNNGRFDKAFTLDFSEHIYDDLFIDIYSAIYKALKPGGKLYLHTPNGEYLLELLKKYGVMRQLPEHIAVRDTADYLHLLNKAGFSSSRVRYLPHYKAPLNYLHCLSYVPWIGILFKARLFIECTKP